MKWCYQANLVLLVLGVLTGCQMLPRSPDTVPGNSADRRAEMPSAGIPSSLKMGALSFESLPQGQCGFLLWTVGGGHPSLVMKGHAQTGAVMILNGQQENFTLVAQKGDMRYGVATHQLYRHTDTSAPMTAPMTIRVDVAFGAAFDKGVYLQNGIIVLTNSQNWERVLPTAGLAGCRSASG